MSCVDTLGIRSGTFYDVKLEYNIIVSWKHTVVYLFVLFNIMGQSVMESFLWSYKNTLVEEYTFCVKQESDGRSKINYHCICVHNVFHSMKYFWPKKYIKTSWVQILKQELFIFKGLNHAFLYSIFRILWNN